MKNSVIARFDGEIADLRHILDTADALTDEQTADLQRQLFAKEHKCREAKLYLFNGAYMDIRSLFAKKYFICTSNAKPAPESVAKRMAFVLRPHVAMKNVRDELRHAAEDLSERLGKEFGWNWELTQNERDDSFVVDFSEPAQDAPVFLPSPAFTGTPALRTMDTLQRVVEQEWRTLLEDIVRDKQIDTEDADEKREAVIDACRSMADHDILWYLSTLPENDGGDFAEVLEDLDDGLLPVNAARYEIAAQFGANL